jgi:hypothetical protein
MAKIAQPKRSSIFCAVRAEIVYAGQSSKSVEWNELVGFWVTELVIYLELVS